MRHATKFNEHFINTKSSGMTPSKFEYLLTNAFLKLSKTTLALIKLKNIEKEHVSRCSRNLYWFI